MTAAAGCAPPGCDAHLFGEFPSVEGGKCRCLTCARCGHHSTSGHQGHYWAGCRATGRQRKPHFCCRDPLFGCELQAATMPLEML